MLDAPAWRCRISLSLSLSSRALALGAPRRTASTGRHSRSGISRAWGCCRRSAVCCCSRCTWAWRTPRRGRSCSGRPAVKRTDRRILWHGGQRSSVYLSDSRNQRVDEFDDGAFVRAWGWGVIPPAEGQPPAEELQVCTGATGCEEGTVGSGAGQLRQWKYRGCGGGRRPAECVPRRRVCGRLRHLSGCRSLLPGNSCSCSAGT